MLSGDPLYDKPRKRKNCPEENPYSRPVFSSGNQPVHCNETFMPENNDDSDHIYSNIIEYGAYANIRQSSTPAVTDDVTVGGSGLL